MMALALEIAYAGMIPPTLLNELVREKDECQHWQPLAPCVYSSHHLCHKYQNKCVFAGDDPGFKRGKTNEKKVPANS